MKVLQRTQAALSQLAYLFHRIVDIEAAWIPLVHGPELKLVLARKLYLDACAAKLLVERLPELLAPRTPQATCRQLVTDLDAAARLVDEADIAAFLIALEDDLQQVLSRYGSEHLAMADEPSLRVTQHILLDRQGVRDALAPWMRTPATVHSVGCNHADLSLPYDGTEPQPALVSLPSRPANWRIEPSHTFYQPTVALLASTELMRQYCQHLYCEIEIPAIEVCARNIAEFRDMPIDFKVDMARQAWDEARHAHLAYDYAAAIGGFDSELVFSGKVWRRYLLGASLGDRLAIQQVIQEGNGFELGLARAYDSVQSQEISNMLAFVAADECQHALIGSKWLMHICDGSVDTYRRFLDHAASLIGFCISILDVTTRLRTGLPPGLTQAP